MIRPGDVVSDRDPDVDDLIEGGFLEPLGHGLYYEPRYNETLGMFIPPSPDEIAEAYGRHTRSAVWLTKSRRDNALGLSTQIPAQPVYMTTGPSRTIKFLRWRFRFIHSSTDDRHNLPALQADHGCQPPGDP